ncbi:hypothetical protein GCM10011571_05870 [Marinithermofilum abyssi]|uniref:Uncharacterized protein n=1 Tax=Marinithermofilum abyssi TaxID=1571185 RepID=A0A8J2YD69_9BACL|nr:hypothetical protein [Marinithermofilum abyssi]GGE07426.1 hypothetical protein GCM10011571_05870 [Marinithermofilum abyssi]
MDGLEPGQADPTPFAAWDEKVEQMEGHELNRLNADNNSAAVSRVIVLQHRRDRGIGETMTHQICRIAFEEMNLHRLES